jgi:transposase
MIDKNKEYYIGIDVSKTVLDLFILPINKHIQFKNDSSGIKALIQEVNLFPFPAIVMEATGGYEKPVAHALSQVHYLLKRSSQERLSFVS